MVKEYIINKENLAKNIGSGDLDVLSTPSLLAYIENCCYLSILEKLEDSQTTVGVKVNLKHLKPSYLHEKVIVVSKITKEADRKIEFEAKVYNNDNELIAVANHTRYIVNNNNLKGE